MKKKKGGLGTLFLITADLMLKLRGRIHPPGSLGGARLKVGELGLKTELNHAPRSVSPQCFPQFLQSYELGLAWQAGVGDVTSKPHSCPNTLSPA